MPLVQVLQHLHNGDGAQAGGGEGTVSAGALGAVDHSAVAVGGDGNAAIHMADDEIQVLIPLAQLLCVDGRNALLIEHMGLGPAVQPRNTRGPGIVAELVHIGGVYGVHFAAVGPAQVIGQHHAQLCRMVAAATVRRGVLHQFFIDGHNPRLLGIGAAAPAYEDIDLLGVNAVLLQKVQQYLAAHRQLVIGGGVFQQLRGIMKDALGEHIFLVFKIAYLGGGRAGVNDQKLVGHDFSPLLRLKKCHCAAGAPVRNDIFVVF